MTDDLLQKAIDFAAEKHKGQKYGDKPYITHCLAVLKRVRQDYSYEPYLVSAVLHDVVEDCEVSLEEIHKEFGPSVHTLVFYLTRIGDQSYAEYIEDIKFNKGASIIKIADLEENISNCTKPEQKHMKDKYELALMFLRS